MYCYLSYFIQNQIPVTKNLLLKKLKYILNRCYDLDIKFIYNIVYKIICHNINIMIEYLIIQNSFY